MALSWWEIFVIRFLFPRIIRKLKVLLPDLLSTDGVFTCAGK